MHVRVRDAVEDVEIQAGVQCTVEVLLRPTRTLAKMETEFGPQNSLGIQHGCSVQQQSGSGLDLVADFGRLLRVEPVEGMVDQGDIQVGVLSGQFLRRGVQTAPTDPEFCVVVIPHAERGGIHRQDTDADAVRFHDLDGATGRVPGEWRCRVEVGLVPVEEGPESFREVQGFVRWVEVTVRLILGFEGTLETIPFGPVHVMVAGDHEQARFRQFQGCKERVEKLGCDVVLRLLARIRDVAGGEDEVRRMLAALPVVGNRPDEGAQDDVLVIGGGLDVEIGNVKPGNAHSIQGNAWLWIAVLGASFWGTRASHASRRGWTRVSCGSCRVRRLLRLWGTRARPRSRTRQRGGVPAPLLPRPAVRESERNAGSGRLCGSVGPLAVDADTVTDQGGGAEPTTRFAGTMPLASPDHHQKKRTDRIKFFHD